MCGAITVGPEGVSQTPFGHAHVGYACAFESRAVTTDVRSATLGAPVPLQTNVQKRGGPYGNVRCAVHVPPEVAASVQAARTIVFTTPDDSHDPALAAGGGSGLGAGGGLQPVLCVRIPVDIVSDGGGT
jgi:hypothetical protein